MWNQNRPHHWNYWTGFCDRQRITIYSPYNLSYLLQDGSYLAEFLLSRGYEVHGILRRSSSFNTGRISHLYADSRSHREGSMHLHYGDLTDSSCLVKIITEVKPTEIYNLGAQSHVKVSFDLAEYTANVDALGTLRILDAIRTSGLEKSAKFYQASTSELYGKVQEVPQSEKTPFYPRSPYGRYHYINSISLMPMPFLAKQVLPKCMPTGLWPITERHMVCLPATESFSIMKALVEVKLLSRGRSLAQWPRSL